MTLPLLAGLVVALVCGVSFAGLYLAVPRRPTVEEWVLHRRALTADPELARPGRWGGRLGLGGGWISRQRFAALAGAAGRDLLLLRLAGHQAPATPQALAQTISSQIGVGAAAGAVAGASLWLLQGRPSLPLIALPAAVVGAVGLPLLTWVRLRLRARRLRRSIQRHLPRVLTGARVLLESGAATPEGALATAAATYMDPAGDLLREAMRLKEVRRLELEAALDEVGERYGVVSFHRLANSFRVGTRYGTQMSALLAEFAGSTRAGWHAEYRERITRAPVLMTVPALVFFVLPLLVLIMFLVFSPLVGTLSQL